MGMGAGAASHAATKDTVTRRRERERVSVAVSGASSQLVEEGPRLRSQGPENGMLPPPSERVLTGVLEKNTITSKGLYWKKRNAVLSRDFLSFGKLVEDWYVQVLNTLRLRERERERERERASARERERERERERSLLTIK